VPVIIHGKSFTIRCKMVKNQDIVKHFKAEASDVKLVADSLSISFKDANEFIRTEIKQKLNLK
jgi:pyridinium-3,5-bisthiocarboxylic acid mononucleotide nickel chelatase